MRKCLLRAVVGCLLVGSWFNASAAEEDSATDQVDLILGGGLLISPEYRNFIDDVYGPFYSDAGGEGWLDLYGGIEIRADQQIALILGCDALINAVDASGGPLDETYANLILVPSVYGQIYFTPERTVYINGGVSLPLPATGSDYFDLENDGLGFGANIGVELADVFRIEAGYTYIPVTAEATSSNPVWSGEKDYSFGGFLIRALLAF